MYAVKELFRKNISSVWHNTRDSVKRGAIVNKCGKTRLMLNSCSFERNISISFDEVLMKSYVPDSLICGEIGTHWEDVGILSGIKRLNSKFSNLVNEQLLNLEENA
jgi:hypothetical protein